MSTPLKIFLIVCAVLVLLAATILLNSLLFSKKPITNTHSISEPFENISISTLVADVNVLPSSDGKATVICQEKEIMSHSVSVADGTLKIDCIDNRRWYEYIGFNFDSQSVTVYLPDDAYRALNISGHTSNISLPSDFSFSDITVSASTGNISCLASASGDIAANASTGSISVGGEVGGNISLATSTGDITVSNAKASSLSVKASTGRISASNIELAGELSVKVSTGYSILSDIECKSLKSTGNTGDITLCRVITTGEFNIERSTGDVTLEACDAGNIKIKTDTGDVTGTLNSTKIFQTHSDTGRVNVPQSNEGNPCQIETDTGNIFISIC